MAGATLGITLGLPLSGLTAAASANPEPPATEQVAEGPSTAEPVAPPPTEPAVEPAPPTTVAPAEPAPPTTVAPAEPAPPTTVAPVEPAPPTTVAPAETSPPTTEPVADPAPTTTAAPAPPRSVTVTTTGASAEATAATATNAITKPTAPRASASAPTNVSGQVRLYWTAPSSNGGSAITDYIIQRSPNGSSSWVTINDGVRSTTGYTVTGLANGTRYYFRVFARNVVGQSPASNTTSAIPRTKPTAPRSLAAAATNVSGQIRLTWVAPSSNGGSAITDYVIQRSPNGSSSWATINDGVRSTTGYTVTGLASGTRYYFRVFARNAVGQQRLEHTSSARSRAQPSPCLALVSYFEVYADYWGFDLYWGDPVSTGGSAITRLRRPGLGLRLRLLVHVQRLGRPLVELRVTSMMPGYGCGTFRIAAANAVGVGPYSAPSRGLLLGLRRSETQLTLQGSYEGCSRRLGAADPPEASGSQLILRGPGCNPGPLSTPGSPTPQQQPSTTGRQVKKAIISTALAAITLIGVASANVAHADGTTPPPWDFYDVPQLGQEAVRGTGCGGDGSIGDVIPDGYWRGYLGRDDGTSIQFDLACVYFQPVANSTPVPDGWLVNNKTRTRTVAKSPGFFVSGTRYQPDGSVPFVQSATVAEGGMYDGDNIPFDGGDTWLYIENGQATVARRRARHGRSGCGEHLLLPLRRPTSPSFRLASSRTASTSATPSCHQHVDLVRPRRHSGRRLVDQRQPEGSNAARHPRLLVIRTLFPYPGQPIEIHVQGQRVTMLTGAMPYDDHCGC